MATIKNILFSITLIIPFLVFPQKKTFDELLKADMNKKSVTFKSAKYFKKAYGFFIKKEWDSTLVNSMKHLSSNNNKELANYCHFFRGYSFVEKNLFIESKSEFILIPSNFIFYPVVNLKLGDVSTELKEFDNAILNYKMAEKQHVVENLGYNLSAFYEKLGICYLNLNETSKAEEYLIKSLNLLEKENDTKSLISLYINFGSLYDQQNKQKQANIYYTKAYDLSKKVNDFELKGSASEKMAIVEENKGNYKVALHYRKELEQWKDSLNNQNKVWAIADFEKKYAIAVKQKQIKALKAENELKKTQINDYTYLAFTLLLFLIGSAFAYDKHLKGTNVILLQKKKLNKLNATKDQLLTIVSHDLRSYINALKSSNAILTSTLESKDYNKLDQLLYQNNTIANGALYLLDNILHWVLLQTKNLYFQKESVHLLSIVQQIEYNHKPLLAEKALVYENNVSNNSFILVDLNSLKIVLRNLFDNAIKYTNKNGKIKIYTQETDSGYCKLIIEDDGIGIDQNTINELLNDTELLTKKSNSGIIGTGIGIQLCKHMIQKNGGMIDIKSEPNKGARIILSFQKTNQNGQY